MKKWILRSLLLAGMCGTLQPAATAGAENDIAIVVNKASFTLAISSSEMRAMFMGDKTHWMNGTKIISAIPGPDRPEFASILKVLFKMEESQFRAFFLQAEFTGKAIPRPQELATSEAVKQFVSHNPAAIGCILASDADDSVRMLRVDGAFPGGDQYKLHLTK